MLRSRHNSTTGKSSPGVWKSRCENDEKMLPEKPHAIQDFLCLETTLPPPFAHFPVKIFAQFLGKKCDPKSGATIQILQCAPDSGQKICPKSGQKTGPKSDASEPHFGCQVCSKPASASSAPCPPTEPNRTPESGSRSPTFWKIPRAANRTWPSAPNACPPRAAKLRSCQILKPRGRQPILPWKLKVGSADE